MSNVSMQTIKDLGLTVRSPRLDPNMPMFDFAEVMAEKMGFPDKESFLEYYFKNNEPVDKKEADKALREKVAAGEYGDVQIAVFEFPKYEYYTGNEGYTSCSVGDAENDYYVNLGMRYKSSCFDFTNQNDYYTTKHDFTGMTNQEKYLEIYEFFQHCYGENFLDAGAIGYVMPMQSDPYMGILDRFRSYVTNVCGLSKEYPENSKQLRQLRKEALYGDMSDKEIRAAIREKYPPAGEMTFRDLYKMTNEMDECGIGGYASSCIEWVFKNRGISDITYREKMLDAPVTSKHMQTMLNSYEAKVYQNLYVDKNLGTVLKELAAEFGAAGGISVDSISKSNNAKNDFVWIKI